MNQWRVSPKLPVLKLTAAAVFALLGLFLATDVVGRSLAALAAAGVAGWAIRDLALPVRLSADADGITLVTGLAHRRRLAWSQIERVRVDERERLGLRTVLLEIDTGEAIHLFSEYDLGVPPADAWAALNRLASSSASP